MNKPLPKSLHTVTVLVQVAKCLRRTPVMTASQAVDMALSILGYDADTVDTYALKAQAIAKLNKGA